MAASWFAFAQAKEECVASEQAEKMREGWSKLRRNLPLSFKVFASEDARFSAATELLDGTEHEGVLRSRHDPPRRCGAESLGPEHPEALDPKP